MINLQTVHVFYNIIEGFQQCRWNSRAKNTKTLLSIKHYAHPYFFHYVEKGRIISSWPMVVGYLLVCYLGINSLPDSQYDSVIDGRYTHMIDQLIFTHSHMHIIAIPKIHSKARRREINLIREYQFLWTKMQRGWPWQFSKY